MNYDHEAERNSQWCDRCMAHHSGPVGVYSCEQPEEDTDDDLDND